MTYTLVVLSLFVLGWLSWRVLRGTPSLRVGEPAPQFQLADQQGTQQTLSAYRGRWLILYFYPKDDTPGCTREACYFRDDSQNLQAMNAQIVGVSMDAPATHARFAAKYHLPFALLADIGGEVAQRYGALIKLGRFKITRRVTFIITPEARVAHIFWRVHPAQHAAEVARTLHDLQRRFVPKSS